MDIFSKINLSEVVAVALIYYPKEITKTKSIGCAPKASLARVCC